MNSKNLKKEINLTNSNNNDNVINEEKEIVNNDQNLIDNFLKEITDLKTKNILLLAEMENLRKWHEKELRELNSYFSRNLFRKLIPSIDMLDSAINSSNVSDELKNWLYGFQMILSNIKETLNEFGIKKMSIQTGDEFNGKFHEALDKVFSNDLVDNKIIDVKQSGYLINNDLLIPAKVIVSKGQNNIGEQN